MRPLRFLSMYFFAIGTVKLIAALVMLAKDKRQK